MQGQYARTFSVALLVVHLRTEPSLCEMVDVQWLQSLEISTLCNGMNSTQGGLKNVLYSSRLFENVALPNE